MTFQNSTHRLNSFHLNEFFFFLSLSFLFYQTEYSMLNFEIIRDLDCLPNQKVKELNKQHSLKIRSGMKINERMFCFSFLI